MKKITNISWLSKESLEAEVHVSDGNFELICFSQPFYGDFEVDTSLLFYTLNTQMVFKLDSNSFSVENTENKFEHRIQGKVVNLEKNQLELGEFILELDTSLPGDIAIGDYISFLCDRIDIIMI